MPTDLERLVVQLSADIRKYEKSFARAQGISTKTFNSIERRARTFDRRLERVGAGFRRSILATTAGLGAAFSAREIKLYADTWTQAGNKIRASGQVAERAGRSLEGVVDIANESRTGITETADLYSKLLRATKDVAKSELEVARATLIVNKAFKAGGAALSEQRAGILQLSQALGSGLLQGDELRSVRENAPLIAQALAREFNTTIAGLKKLGADGELAIDRVFKAILNAQPDIEKAFGKTNATIADSFTRVNNAFTQYIGQADASNGASRQLVNGLTALADNFETTADIALKFAGIIAAGILGRSIGRMIANIGLGSAAILEFANNLRLARTIAAGGIVTSAIGAAGPIGAAVGLAGTALFLFTQSLDDAGESTEVASRKADIYAKALKAVRDAADDTGEAVEDAGKKFVASQTLVLKKAAEGFRKDIADAKDELRALVSDAIRGDFQTLGITSRGPAFADVEKELKALVETIDDADFDTGQFLETLSKIGDQRSEFEEAALGAASIIERINALILSLQNAQSEVGALGQAFADLSASQIEFNDKALERSIDRAQDARDAFLAGRLTDAGRSDVEKQIDTRVEQIRRAFDKAAEGADNLTDKFAELTDEAARKQAIDELAREATAKLTQSQLDAAINLIKGFEGSFQATPFRDINERGEPDRLRIGFSSDTVTLLDRAGNEIVQNVVAGMRITFDDAMRDLIRRIKEGREEIAGQIGQERFDALTAEQQAVLSSLEFNFGTLPDRIVKALVDGDAGDVARAIKEASTGVNRDRRAAEAEVFLGNASIEVQAREQRLSVITETVAAIAQQNQMIGLETGLIGASNAAREAAILRQETLNSLAAQGITLTDQVIAQVEREVAARFNKVAAYDAEVERVRQLQDAQDDLIRQQQELAGAFEGALRGFISDLVAGKNATEALANAVGRLADQLLQIALNRIFASLFGGFGFAGGGLARFKDGGQIRRLQHGGLIRGPGGPRDDQIPVLASNKEFIVNARATRDNRQLLEAINSGKVKSFADGGFIGSRKPGLAASAGMFASAPAPVVQTNVINRFDSASFLSEALSTPEGQRIILNDVSARPEAWRSALGI